MTQHEMFGFPKAQTNTGYPYGDTTREPVRFDASRVVAIGKVSSYGSAALNLWVRLDDGTELGFRACDQSKPIQSWVRRVAGPKKLRPGIADRSIGWRFAWVEVKFPG
jgi:hypothetical protein